MVSIINLLVELNNWEHLQKIQCKLEKETGDLIFFKEESWGGEGGGRNLIGLLSFGWGNKNLKSNY